MIAYSSIPKPAQVIVPDIAIVCTGAQSTCRNQDGKPYNKYLVITGYRLGGMTNTFYFLGGHYSPETSPFTLNYYYRASNGDNISLAAAPSAKAYVSKNTSWKGYECRAHDPAQCPFTNVSFSRLDR